MSTPDTREYLTLTEIAERIEVQPRTMRGYHTIAEQRRRDEAPRPGDLPAPDARFGVTPVWLVDTVNDWISKRPGRGAGGGPKRKDDAA